MIYWKTRHKGTKLLRLSAQQQLRLVPAQAVLEDDHLRVQRLAALAHVRDARAQDGVLHAPVGARRRARLARRHLLLLGRDRADELVLGAGLEGLVDEVRHLAPGALDLLETRHGCSPRARPGEQQRSPPHAKKTRPKNTQTRSNAIPLLPRANTIHTLSSAPAITAYLQWPILLFALFNTSVAEGNEHAS